jgi:xylan 1,4-beta-xylosidase
MSLLRASLCCVWLSLALPFDALTAAELRIDAKRLATLPPGTKVAPSVKATPDGLAFSEGGIRLATSPYLTAAQGLVDMTCQTPQDWPVVEDRTLFHAASTSHVHATLLFRDGVLKAVYKGGEAYFSILECREVRAWRPGSWHRVQFGWQAQGTTVEFQLVVDGQQIGMAEGRLMEPWPATCEIGVRNGASPWRGVLRAVLLSQQTLVPPALVPGARTITVYADRNMGPCYRFWTVANCNKPHAFLDPQYGRALPTRQPFIRQINMVYLLGGRYPDKDVWYQGVTADGKLRADFRGMVAELRNLRDAKLVPWIVLDNTPYAMSHPPQENAYGNTAPPDDERLWAQYVEAAVRAMVDAFGRAAVAQWWFRVGTEPDLTPGHWSGTKEQYLAHYDHTVAAVGRVLPEAKIGPGNILNPAGGEFGTKTRRQWGLDIIDHAAAGTNAVTGRTGTRMDWFSFSWYGRVGEPLTVFDSAVTAIRRRMARYPQLGDIPLVVGEFAVLHDESGHRLWGGDTTEWAASFYAALANRVYRHRIQQVHEWGQTTAGLLHPRAQVIAMLDRMADGQRVAVDVHATSAADSGAIACRRGEELCVLLYNHRHQRRPHVPETIHLVLRDPRMQAGGKWRVSETYIDAEHGTWAHAFTADCAAAGIRPQPGASRYEGSLGKSYGTPGAALFRKNLDQYAKLAVPGQSSRAIKTSDGACWLDFEMPGHSVRLLTLSASPRP